MCLNLNCACICTKKAFLAVDPSRAKITIFEFSEKRNNVESYHKSVVETKHSLAYSYN